MPFESEEHRDGMTEEIQVKREITLEADAAALERMRKEGTRGVYCDESERTGGARVVRAGGKSR